MSLDHVALTVGKALILAGTSTAIVILGYGVLSYATDRAGTGYLHLELRDEERSLLSAALAVGAIYCMSQAALDMGKSIEMPYRWA